MKKNSIIEEIIFPVDEFMLKGYLHLPPVTNPPFVIGCHGLFSDKNSPKQIELAKHCNRLNMAYFRFDHRGCGESKASFEAVTSLDGRCTDLKAAANMLRTRDDLGDQMGLFGSSMGGSVCLAVAGDLAAHAVVTWAAPIRSADLFRPHVHPAADSNTPFKKNPFDISKPLASLRNILIFHGDADEIVPLPHAQEIYERVSEPKKLSVFPHSDHRMSRPSDQQAFQRQATLWFQAHLKADKN
ncbi:MAG: alpha/beta hydrolase [Desulfobacterales bacterium]|nr:alpha/beta hydrolase [Desulfobacterales bacterium]